MILFNNDYIGCGRKLLIDFRIRGFKDGRKQE